MKRASLILGASLLLLELLLHLFPLPRLASNWVYDPVLGHRGPRNEIVRALSPALGFRYNSYGFRGEDPTPRGLKQDQYSVFIFGDSITEADGIPPRRTYPARLEHRLSESLQRDVEVNPWAASDYGTANELLLFAREARSLQPNVVILQFLGLNDFVNNGLSFARQNKSMSDFARPYLLPEKNPQGLREFFPIQDSSLAFTYPQPERRFLRENFRLFGFFEFFWIKRQWTQRISELRAKPELDACSLESGIFYDKLDERWQEALAATRRLAAAFKAEVEKISLPGGGSARFLAFYAPSYYEVFDPVWNRAFELNLLRCSNQSYARENPEKRFLKIFAEANVEAISLKGAFKNAKIPIQKLFLPDGHYSAEGHRLVAEALAQYLSAKPEASSRQR